jgi:uncharacterized protein YcbX
VVVAIDGWEGSVRSPDTAIRVSEVVGEPVTLKREGAVPHHDEGGVHVVSTSSLRFAGDIDVARLRPNVLVELDGDAPTEQSWLQEELAIDSAVLRVIRPMPRCVMMTLAQGGLPFEPSLLREIEARSDGCLGVVAEVEHPGTARIHD